MKLGAPVLAAAAVLCIILFAASAFLFFENASLTGSLADARASLNKTKAEKAGLEATLIRTQGSLMDREQQVTDLSSRLGGTELELNETQATLAQREEELQEARNLSQQKEEQLAGLRDEFRALESDIRETQETINESIQWFRDNSEMPPDLRGFSDSVTGDCREGSGYNLACFAFILERDDNFRYLNETTDRLYSLEEIVQRSGGDCEDYSLLLAAMLRSLAKEDPDEELVAWTPSPGEKFTVYERGTRTWYYDGHAVELGALGSVYPYPICYLTDVSGDTPIGHCIVALSTKKAGDAGGLAGLDNARAFEPQNGEYMGRVGTTFHLCADGEMDCAHEGDIIMVMGEDDLYEFGDGRWDSLEIQGGKAGEMLAKVSEAMEALPPG